MLVAPVANGNGTDHTDDALISLALCVVSSLVLSLFTFR